MTEERYIVTGFDADGRPIESLTDEHGVTADRFATCTGFRIAIDGVDIPGIDRVAARRLPDVVLRASTVNRAARRTGIRPRGGR